MLGTAFPSPSLLLVEQPGPWGRAGLAESDFDRSVAARLVAELDQIGVRVLAVRRPGRSDPEKRHWALVDCRLGFEGMAWGTFGVDDELLDHPWRTGAGVPVNEPAYLVCAHGRHDACCAIRGRPVAASLEALRPGQVWECSHVGGDRFAANVLVVPNGMLYGTVHSADVPALVAATDCGEALSHRLRGKVGLPPAVQTAVAAVQAAWGGAVESLRVVANGRTGPESAVVRVERHDAAGQRSADVAVSWHRSEPHRLTCQVKGAATVLVYEVDSVTEVAHVRSPP